jgi:nicotinamidase-related amidase
MNETIPTIDPARTALLVMDYQAAILAAVPEADALLTRVAAAISIARSRGVQIGYVRVALDDADYDAMPHTNKGFAAAAAGRRMHVETPATAIHGAVAPLPGDLLVRKTRVGAFSTTELDQQLHARKVDTLVLAGISTSGVVLSTVRDAADRDYRLYVLEDGCFDRDHEVHDVLMQKVFPRQADVISIADLSGILGPAA